MAPNANKATYRSYEAQARLIRAIVAAHPEQKWNYKEIAACYGSDMTKDALNHRFRHLKAEALIIQQGRKQGLDMKHLAFEGALPGTQSAVDTNDIAKYFGQSTPDGIQFQFRTIKKDAEKLRQVEADGGDVATALATELSGGATTPMAVTPSKPTPRRRVPASGGSTAKKRGKKSEAVAPIKAEDMEDDATGAEADDEVFEVAARGEETPSKRPRMMDNGTRTPLPLKRDATAAGLPVRAQSGTLSRAMGLENSQSASTAVEALTPTSSDQTASTSNAPSQQSSIFAPASPKAGRNSKANGVTNNNSSKSPFKTGGEDVFAGSQEASSSMYTNVSFSYVDGEI